MRASDTEQPYDAGDAVSVKEKEKRAKVREERRLNGLRQIMETADGRLWMWDYLSNCGLFAVRFSGNASKDAFDNGMRNSAMPTFVAILKHCMSEYMLMVKENGGT